MARSQNIREALEAAIRHAVAAAGAARAQEVQNAAPAVPAPAPAPAPVQAPAAPAPEPAAGGGGGAAGGGRNNRRGNGREQVVIEPWIQDLAEQASALRTLAAQHARQEQKQAAAMDQFRTAIQQYTFVLGCMPPPVHDLVRAVNDFRVANLTELAECHAGVGERKEALAFYQQARECHIKVCPDPFCGTGRPISVSIAKLCLAVQDFKVALETIAPLVLQDPETPQYLELQADAERGLKQWPAACGSFQRAASFYDPGYSPEEAASRARCTAKLNATIDEAGFVLEMNQLFASKTWSHDAAVFAVLKERVGQLIGYNSTHAQVNRWLWMSGTLFCHEKKPLDAIKHLKIALEILDRLAAVPVVPAVVPVVPPILPGGAAAGPMPAAAGPIAAQAGPVDQKQAGPPIDPIDRKLGEGGRVHICNMIAQCYLELQQWKFVEEFSTRSMELVEDVDVNREAYERRTTALEHMGNLGKAYMMAVKGKLSEATQARIKGLIEAKAEEKRQAEEREKNRKRKLDDLILSDDEQEDLSKPTLERKKSRLDSTRTMLHLFLHEMSDMKKRLTEMADAKIPDCTMCRSAPRSVRFNCAHVISCDACAGKIDKCPLCRADITKRDAVFM